MISGMPPRPLRLLRLLVDVRPGEVAALLWSFGYYFLLLSGYYLLRPLREEMGVALGTREMTWLFWVTFSVCLLLVPLYAWLLQRFPRRRVVTYVYRFFVLNLLTFFVLWRTGVAHLAVARVFFVWVSVYNIFIVSVMWSVMADSWTTDQGKRLFGFIAAGGSAGALAGPAISALLARSVPPSTLVFATAVLLEAATQCMRNLPFVARSDAERAVGGGLLDGIKRVLSSPFLAAICGQILLYGLTTTFIYMRQAEILKPVESGDRRRLFALQDTFVNLTSIALQSSVTGRVMALLGLGIAMAMTPLVTLGGFVALIVAPSVYLVVGLYALRRAVHFAFDRPAREVLFTTVPREDKYKSKNVIDNVVFRGGDAIGGSAFAALGALALPMGIPFALAWLGCAIYLARAHARRARAPQGATS